MARKVLVTGGNSGIGLALCKQLALDHGCHVFLGSRSASRGKAAVESIEIPSSCSGLIELLEIDVTVDASVQAAAKSVKSSLGSGEKLYALVNNAGIGISATADPDTIINTNLIGVKRVTEAFLPLVSHRVINLGSGAGPAYVNKCPFEAQKLLSDVPESWEQITSFIDLSDDQLSGLGSPADTLGGYGLSKALLASYTMLLAKEQPGILFSSCSPGFINTKMVSGLGATKTPEEGTFSIQHCLFDELEGNGWYYGSDGVRSPLHFVRNPGEPAYDGVPPS